MRHSQAHSSNFYHIFSANALRDPPMTSVVTVIPAGVLAYVAQHCSLRSPLDLWSDNQSGN